LSSILFQKIFKSIDSNKIAIVDAITAGIKLTNREAAIVAQISPQRLHSIVFSLLKNHLCFHNFLQIILLKASQTHNINIDAYAILFSKISSDKNAHIVKKKSHFQGKKL